MSEILLIQAVVLCTQNRYMEIWRTWFIGFDYFFAQIWNCLIKCVSPQRAESHGPVEIISHWHPNLTINMVDDHTAWVKGSVPPPLDQRKIIFYLIAALSCFEMSELQEEFNVIDIQLNLLEVVCPTICGIPPLSPTRCQVRCSKRGLLPHRVLQWLLEPPEGLLSHQWDPDKTPTAPHLLPAVPVALAAVRRPERPLAMELPARGHVRAVRWRPRLCQGRRSTVKEVVVWLTDLLLGSVQLSYDIICPYVEWQSNTRVAFIAQCCCCLCFWTCHSLISGLMENWLTSLFLFLSLQML